MIQQFQSQVFTKRNKNLCLQGKLYWMVIVTFFITTEKNLETEGEWINELS